MPGVFIGGKFIGGGEETNELHKSGKLAEILKANHILWYSQKLEQNLRHGKYDIWHILA